MDIPTGKPLDRTRFTELLCVATQKWGVYIEFDSDQDYDEILKAVGCLLDATKQPDDYNFNILAEILRALWELGILPQADVRNIITEIRTKDNLKFRTTDSIFKP